MQDYELKELVQRALGRAYFYLKFRPRTRKELSDFLHKKAERFHWPEEVVSEAIKELEEEDLINDEKFLKWYVEERNIHKRRSAFALRSELLRHGIAKDLMDEYFSQSPVQEESLALEALKQKWHRFERLDKRERFRKSAAFLSRRGFSFDMIKQAVKALEES